MGDEGTLVKLFEADDAMQAEQLVDFLEDAGIQSTARTASDGVLGSLGTTYVIEVAQTDEAKAVELLRAYENEQQPDAASAPEAPADEKDPQYLSTNVTAAYRRASIIMLVVSAGRIVLNLIEKNGPLPVEVFVSCAFDFLIWRRFADEHLLLTSAKKVRFFALSRVLFGAVFTLAVVINGAPREAFLLIVLAFVAFLYLRSPVAGGETVNQPAA